MNKMGVLDGYCYGPADLVRVWKGPSTLCLQLSDSAGKTAEAIYEGCAYLPSGRGYTGMHLSLVQEVTAEQLLQRCSGRNGITFKEELGDVKNVLENWEKTGLKLFLHICGHTEFLVAAKNLNYRIIA